MKAYIEQRVVEVGKYIIASKSYSRGNGKFGISKSTVHKDLTERLTKDRPNAKARSVLDVNKMERHIRGEVWQREKVHWQIICALTSQGIGFIYRIQYKNSIGCFQPMLYIYILFDYLTTIFTILPGT